ncbi:MAG TPA: AMP-binding protein, partial [Polyangiaceae bacterium]|nr:AMP-binding protein [Polyangiaceae bacterium]
ERAALDLSSWTKALNGSEPVLEATLSRFAATFAVAGFRRSAFRPCYGLAEATLLVSGAARQEEPRVLPVTRASVARGRVERAALLSTDVLRLPASGRVAAGVDVQIVEPSSGLPCDEGQIGEIWVAGPHVAVGYFRDEATTEAVFGGKLPGRPQRFLRTGDLGFLEGDHLFISGRSKDVIVQRGTNHYPHDIERTAEAVEGVSLGGVAAFGVRAPESELEQVVLLVEVQRHAGKPGGPLESLADRIREEVSDVHGVSVLEIKLVQRGSIPRTSSGKTRRSAARDLYLTHQIREVCPNGSGSLGFPAQASNHEEGTRL